jgi:RNA polymerase sigma factor (TIGR02999 family)
MDPEMGGREVTELLDAWSSGDRQALDRLVPLVIDDLRALARAYLARERPGHTLQPTALVNEAFLRLIGRRKVQIEGRVQFFAVLAQTMRRILVDHARRKKAARHGGGAPPVPIEEVWGLPVRRDVDLIALDDALTDLASFAPRQAEAVQLSYFAGLTFDEIALALEVSPVTVQRDLKAAKMWLLQELQRQEGMAGGHP